MSRSLLFHIYRDSTTTSDELIRNIVDEFKSFVFESIGITLSSAGYSGIPLIGEIPACCCTSEIYKVINSLFCLSKKLDGLVFSIKSENATDNPIYKESLKNDVIPKWATSPENFLDNVFGYGGVLHVISPEIAIKFNGESGVDIVRKSAAQTRNILVTESINQVIADAHINDFGMHRTSVNVPSSLAYIAKERPDLLSFALSEYAKCSESELKEYEKQFNEDDCVMVHILLNTKDWNFVTGVADIESPSDIVSHRVGLALIAFDKNHSSIPNGLEVPVTGTFQKVHDQFERERLEAVRANLFGTPQAISHMYQCAKSLTTSKHHAECRKIFVDESSSEQQSAYSGDEDDESEAVKYAKKQIFKKKRGDLGKKRELAPIMLNSDTPEVSVSIDERTPTSSNQLKNFERAVNGDDIYKESSDGDSLGEDEDMDLFVTKTKKQLLEIARRSQKPQIADEHWKQKQVKTDSDDDGFDVSDLLKAAPPLAKSDDFEDFDKF